ncbi:putative multidrug resistance protein MdtD [Metallosphaera sp. J1]|uniref:MFS transporter n=1 Tax=Metallosphaera javensis (ex Hofmann et al. 2022) TaxID=99938 RepID=UPI001EE08173|nr:MFS transporter [Metallosphaera javensis (ex Hofmann et al. 2022)]MCG3108547.1 putative multidrug resistance protein MdtD [Metallosphaera javensis (ex Hofmann et al. 2022)]
MEVPKDRSSEGKDYDLKYAYKALSVLAPLAIVVMYTEGMLIPSLVKIEDDFGVNAAQVSWVLTVYLLTGSVMNPIAGKLGDMFGKKRVLTIIIWIYAVGVTLTGFAPNFDFLIFARAIQGLGLAMFPLAFSLIREEFPPKLVPTAQGIVSAMFGAGSAIALPIGAYISQNFGWQYTYHTVIPFVALMAILTSTQIRESKFKNPNTRIDFVGAGILSISLASLILGFSEAPTWGWSSPLTIGTLLLSAITFATFIYFQSITPFPLISVKLLKRRNVLVANVAAVVAGFAVFMGSQTLTYLFEEPNPVGFGLDIQATGLALLPTALIQLIGGPLAGKAISRSGPRKVMIVGSTALIPVYLVLSLLTSSGGSQSINLVITFATLAMLGATLLNVSLVNLLTFSVERQVMGTATSINTVFRLVGGTIGPSVAGAIMGTYQSSIVEIIPMGGTTVYYPVVIPSDQAFSLIYLLATLLAVVMTGISFMTKDIKIGNVMKERNEFVAGH